MGREALLVLTGDELAPGAKGTGADADDRGVSVSARAAARAPLPVTWAWTKGAAVAVAGGGGLDVQECTLTKARMPPASAAPAIAVAGIAGSRRSSALYDPVTKAISARVGLGSVPP